MSTHAPTPDTITIPIAGMSPDEARSHVAKINAAIAETKWLLLDLYEREGWKALGYSSWRECAQSELKFGQSHVYELLDSARVARNLAGCSDMSEIGVTFRQVRALRDVPPEAQADVFSEARRKGEGRAEPEIIEDVARERGYIKEPRMPVNVKCTLCTFESDDLKLEGKTHAEVERDSGCKGHIIYKRGRAVSGVVALKDMLTSLSLEQRVLTLLYCAEEVGHTKLWEFAEKAKGFGEGAKAEVSSMVERVGFVL